jgi:hypothetical protein
VPDARHRGDAPLDDRRLDLAVTQRDEIIAKLRLFMCGDPVYVVLPLEACKQIIADLEYAQFAHEQLEHTEGKPALLRRKGNRKA